ncbi:MAG: glutamate--tRNA ligase [Candidatus Aenigmatarchaeota archaeon]
MPNLKDIALKHALLNAKEFGKAQMGSVMGKVIAEAPDAKKDIEALKKEVAAAIAHVNKMKADDIDKELKKFGKIEKPEKEEREGLPPLPGAVKGKVVTRFPPFPSGALHIGNMKAAVTSYEYAKMYKGKFIVRIEDTDPDPAKVAKDNVELIKKDLEVMGLKWNKFYLCSEKFGKHYKLAEKLIKEFKAYACTCPVVEAAKEGRMGAAKEECECRSNSIERNMELWKEMLGKKLQPGQAVLRLKTDINDPNPALRDPVIMRMKSGKNPTTGVEHWVYPSYNFNSAVEDHDEGITHILRGTEHAFNTIIQKKICDELGWTDYEPVAINFGFLYMPGEKVHKRFIRDAIAAGKFAGWDDPRLGQYGLVRALIRRGITPQAIKSMIIEMGVGAATVHFEWEKLYSENRKVIDKTSDRYFFVGEPIEIKLDKVPVKTVKAPVYPGKRKYRSIPTSKKVFVDKTDFVANRGKEVRLMHFANFIMDSKARYTGLPLKDIPKIHWVPEKNMKIKLIMPDGKEVDGLAEPGLKKVKPGQIVQFERIGFARCDAPGVFYFAHR